MLPSDPSPHHRIRLDAIVAAPADIDPVFLDTPQYECQALSEALGCRLTIKVETANPIRSFKGRGGSLLIASLARHQASDLAQPVVSASAGNWGQALAYACRSHRRSLVLFAAETANALKIERMHALGADVRMTGVDFDAAVAAGRAHAAEHGLHFVADSQEVETSVGAGTIAVELLERGQIFDAVLVPLGNGALLTGIGRWLKAASPSTKVIGVSAAGADAMAASWREGRIVERPSVATQADGIAVRVPIPQAVHDMTGTVDEVLLVDDDAILRAVRLLFDTAGLLVEPAGAAGVAALLAFRRRFVGQRMATVLCGGNMTMDQMRRWLT